MWVLGLGVAGVLVAATLGPFVLALVYRPDFASNGGLLVAIMGVAALGYIGIALGYALTAARAFDAQVLLLFLVAASCGAASWLLVPRFDLRGAVMALAIAACLQIGGQLMLLSRAVHRMADPR